MQNFNTKDYNTNNKDTKEKTKKDDNPLMDVSCTGILGTPEERYMYISFSNGRAYTEIKVMINKDGSVKEEPDVVSSKDVTYEEMDTFKAYVLTHLSEFVERAKGINVFKSFMK